MAKERHIVTGAYGFTGKYIARRLLDAGHEVHTLTNSLKRDNPFGDAVKAHPYHFDDPAKLVEKLRGADVLYNTYWVRFNYGDFTHNEAVRNTMRLFEAAQEAGVQRVVHVSITNPSQDSHLEYFHDKAVLEQALKDSGLSHGILRPAVIFGDEDILINNIAWALRSLPVFGVFGDGKYRLQPIFVEDFADAAVALGASRENAIVEGIGPETFTFEELVRTVGKIIGKERPVIHVPPSLGYAAAWVLGKIKHDVMLTRPEVEGLMADLLCVENAPPAGPTKLTDWLEEHRDTIGKKYSSELARRRDRNSEYGKL